MSDLVGNTEDNFSQHDEFGKITKYSAASDEVLSSLSYRVFHIEKHCGAVVNQAT